MNERPKERGRPRLYDDPEVFAEKAEAYFAHAETEGKMPTLSGICIFLGFHDKESFSNYASYGEAFSRTVKSARLRIEEDRNQRLANPACTGVIFDLKHNHGWTDKSQTELTGAEGGPIQSMVDVVGLTEEQLRALASIPVQRG